MKILFYGDWQIGGPTQQILCLKKEIQKLNCIIDFSNDLNIDLKKYDCVHLTGINLPKMWPYFTKCMNENIPFFTKSIFNYTKKNSNKEIIKKIILKTKALFMEYPNEDQEIELFCGAKPIKKYHTLASVDDDFFKNENKEKKFIHVNGRYNINKNQLFLIKICKKLNLPLITSGYVQNYKYFLDCFNENYGEVYGECSAKQINEILNKTKIYVCCSNREICSTSICEAIHCGCLILSTSTHLSNSEFKEEGYFIYENKNEDEFVEKLLKIYNGNYDQKNKIITTKELAKFYVKAFQECLK